MWFIGVWCCISVSPILVYHRWSVPHTLQSNVLGAGLQICARIYPTAQLLVHNACPVSVKQCNEEIESHRSWESYVKPHSCSGGQKQTQLSLFALCHLPASKPEMWFIPQNPLWLFPDDFIYGSKSIHTHSFFTLMFVSPILSKTLRILSNIIAGWFSSTICLLS